MSRVLITGGDGFIGSHLADRLENDGYEVDVIDDHSTSVPRRSQIDEDVYDHEVVRAAVRKADFVFHLAHVVGVSYLRENLWWCIRSGLSGTEVIADACADYETPLLLASSSEVYGACGDHSFPRFSANERIVYPVSKLAEELIVRTDEGLDWRIARIFNTIGPRQLADYGMVVPGFIRSALKGSPLIVHGTGEQVRWFAHVEDVVGQLIRLMNGFGGVVKDVGDSMETTIMDLAGVIVKLTDSDSDIITCYKPFGSAYDDLYRVKPRVEWSGRDLDDVLKETIEWWRKNPQLWED